MIHKLLYIVLFLSFSCSLALAQNAPDTTVTNPFAGDWQPQTAPDTVLVDSTRLDSTSTDSLLADSLAVMDSSLVTETLPDTLIPIPEIIMPVIHGLRADTTLYRGTGYGSFKDVFSSLPGTYLADRGMVGDDSRGAMYAGVPGEFDLYYDFLYLNDPVTGLADVSMIPVQSIGSMQQVLTHAKGELGHTIAGQSLLVTPLDIATFPPRSIVSYRTGQNDYNDIDVRVGLYTSEKMQINAGGILKSYMGQVDRNRYDGQKLNLQVRRKLGGHFTLDYLYLQNQTELDDPVLQYAGVYGLADLHRTIKRYDQGLALRYGRLFSTTLQYTDYRNDFYNLSFNNRDYYQTRSTGDYRAVMQGQYGFMGIDWSAGGEFYRQELTGTGIQAENFTRTQGWLNAAFNREWLSVSAGVKQVMLDERDESYTLPQVSLFWRPVVGLTAFAWANQFIRPPSFDAMYAIGLFYAGNPDLKTATYDQAGGGIEIEWGGLRAWTSISGMNIANQVAVYAETDQDTGAFINQMAHSRYAWDWAVAYDWKYGLSGTVKGKSTFIESDDEYFDITNYPAFYSQGYLQYHNILFKGDLDLTVRLGATFTGESFTPERYFAQYPLSEWIADPIVVPYLLIMPKVWSMTMFISFHNLANANYQQVFAYPMPKYEFRWGFTWQFYD